MSLIFMRWNWLQVLQKQLPIISACFSLWFLVLCICSQLRLLTSFTNINTGNSPSHWLNIQKKWPVTFTGLKQAFYVYCFFLFKAKAFRNKQNICLLNIFLAFATYSSTLSSVIPCIWRDSQQLQSTRKAVALLTGLFKEYLEKMKNEWERSVTHIFSQ